MRCAKGMCAKGFGGCTRSSFLMLRPRERASLRPLFPPQEGVSDPFSHRKRENLVHLPNPLAQIPSGIQTPHILGKHTNKHLANMAKLADKPLENREVFGRFFVPEILQSGFGVNFLFWSGEFWENCRRILIANFDSEFFGPSFPERIFRPFFSRTSAPPKNSRPKFTPRNCRHSSPISLSRIQNLFTLLFCLQGIP